MTADKHQVLATLEEIGLLLELLGENPFKSRAYSNAARALERDERDLAELVETGALTKVKGVGKGVAEKVVALVREGSLPYHQDLRAKVPEGIFEVLKVKGLGPKKVRKLWDELGIESLAELEYACTENRLVTLDGFGPKSQAKVLDGVAFLKSTRGRRRLADVLGRARELAVALGVLDGVEVSELAGALRRRCPVVEGIEVVLGAAEPEAVRASLAGVEGVAEVVDLATGQVELALTGGLKARVVLARTDRFGAALALATGAAGHRAALVAHAREAGFTLDGEGLGRDGGTVATADEGALFEALGLAPIPPELREGGDEVAQAAAGELPALVRAEDLQGALHLHTTRSDGAHDLREMALAARDLGYAYLGVSEHSATAVYAGGLSDDELAAQRAEVDALNAEDLGIRVLQGIESDILPDGSLDYPDEVLADLDFVIGSVHSSFGMPEAEMTARLTRAMENPHLDMLGHPTGRILLGREGYALDMDAVLDKAAETGVVMEINANPARLDLDWEVLPGARARGVKVAVNPDAHSTRGLEDAAWGIDTARKGGLTAADVVNTRGADDFLAGLRRNRG